MALTEKDLPKIQFTKQPDNFGCRMVGEVYQQMGPFEWQTHDWNNDGDVYDEKVAKFQKISGVNSHSPNYFSLTEWEFRDLKDEGCIAYVKETDRADNVVSSLDDMLASASSRMKQQAKQVMKDMDKQISFSDTSR